MHDASIEDLAKLTNFSVSFVSEVEDLPSSVTLDVLDCYARVFKIEISDIIAVAQFIATGALPTLHPKIEAMLKLMATVNEICPSGK